MKREDLSEAVFGGADGAVSAVGVIAPLIVIGARPAVIVTSSVGLAICATWSMAAGQYLAKPSFRLAVVMGMSTLLFSILPALPFVFGTGRVLGAVLAGVITFATAVLIAEAQPGPRSRDYRVTFFLLGVGVVLAVAWGLIAP